jgi:hypothetical protein
LGTPNPQIPSLAKDLALKDGSPLSLPLKSPTKGVVTRLPETPSGSVENVEIRNETEKEFNAGCRVNGNVSFGYQDELSDIIEGARSLQHVVGKLAVTVTQIKSLNLDYYSHLILKMTKTLPTNLRPKTPVPALQKLSLIRPTHLRKLKQKQKPGRITFNAWRSMMATASMLILTPKP